MVVLVTMTGFAAGAIGLMNPETPATGSAALASTGAGAAPAKHTREQGPAFVMTVATLSSGGVVFTDGSFAVLGQTFVGSISNGQFTMAVGIVPLLLAGPAPPLSCLPPVVTGGISSRYIQIEPDASITDPVAFHIVCGTDGGSPNEGWVQLTHVDYPEDPAGTVLVNIGKTTADCTDADFLTPDVWTSNGNNALYVTGLPVCPSRRASAPGGASDSRPTVTARCVDCAAPDAASVQPADPTWVYCDSSGDGQTTFFADLFKQFQNTAAAGGPAFTGPDAGIEVDTQGNWKDVPDQQVTFFSDIFQCFGATAAGGGDTWTGPTCP
ncbi:MAG: hypothetical protein V3W34_14590 [Phycisphaerae bacterium]